MRFLLRHLAVGCLLAPLFVAGTHAETLRLRADTWMPYNGAPGDEPPGYVIELARAIFPPEGITVDYQNMPWGEALKAVAAGEIDAVVGCNKDEAEGLVLPAECVGFPRVALMVRKDSTWRYQNILSLRDVRLGVIQEYKYWPACDEYLAKHSEPQVVKLSGDHPLDDGLARVLKGDLDVFAETSTVFTWALKRSGHSPAEFRVAYLHEGDPVYFAFSPKNNASRHYADLIDAGVRELRRSGKLREIMARYGLKDWQEQP